MLVKTHTVGPRCPQKRGDLPGFLNILHNIAARLVHSRNGVDCKLKSLS